jgi:hypothetical protein
MSGLINYFIFLKNIILVIAIDIWCSFFGISCDGREYFFIESLIQNEALIIVVPLQVTSFILY